MGSDVAWGRLALAWRGEDDGRSMRRTDPLDEPDRAPAETVVRLLVGVIPVALVVIGSMAFALWVIAGLLGWLGDTFASEVD